MELYEVFQKIDSDSLKEWAEMAKKQGIKEEELFYHITDALSESIFCNILLQPKCRMSFENLGSVVCAAIRFIEVAYHCMTEEQRKELLDDFVADTNKEVRAILQEQQG